MGRGSTIRKPHFYSDFIKSLDVIEGAVYRIKPRVNKDQDFINHLKRTEFTFLGFGGQVKDLLFFYDSIYKIQTAFKVMDFCATTRAADRYDEGAPDYTMELLRLPPHMIKMEDMSNARIITESF